MSKQYLKQSIKGVLAAASGMTFAIWGGAPVLAQQADPEVEEVVVLGVRSALETALEVKRNSSAIVDHISADDINGFPALDLGETLQAIPGIQLNRDSERRQSEISLRGFSGGFVLQTANGQEFANPTRSQSLTSPSPFGAFESGVFSGVTVYKSQQADLIEGGIAGVIDKKLPDALSREGTGGAVSLGMRYEDLNQTFDPELQISGHHHFIEDELAGAFKLAMSSQSWRKDVFFTPSYTTLDARSFVSPVDENNQALFEDFEAYKAHYGMATDAALYIPQVVRSVADANDGDRLSFTGNIAWQTTDALKLNMDVLYAKRNMNASELENFQFETNRAGSIMVRPTGEPFRIATKGTVDENVNSGDDPEDFLFDNDQWAVTELDFANSRLDYGNREFDFLEQTQAVFFGAEWETDNLFIESNLAISSAKNEFVQVSFANRLRNVSVPVPQPGEPEFLDFGLIGNGVHGTIRTRGTDVSALYADVDGAESLSLLDLPYYSVDANGNAQPPGRNNTSFTPGVRINGGTANFGIGANSQTVERDLVTWDLSALYEVDMPVIASIKAGVRITSDESTSSFLNHSLEGTATDLLSSDLQIRPYSATGSAFFNGEMGRPILESDGWLSIDVDRTIALLQSRGITPADGQQLTAAGFIARNNPAGGQAGQNFDATQDTSAAFVMANLEHDFGSAVTMTGNAGVRFVNTSITTEGLQLDPTDRTVANPYTAENDYDNVLPSFNLNFSIQEDWMVRLSANKGMTRPNIKGLKPSLELRARDRATPEPTPTDPNPMEEDSFDVKLPSANVEALTAVSLDLTVEWYNRDGSNVGLALFQKDFKGKFESNSDLCPSTFTVPGYDTLQLTFDESLSECLITNSADILFDFDATDGDGNPLPPEDIEILNLSEQVNSSETETFVGVEIFATQNLDFLPGFWSGFGMNASYTHLENKDDGDFYRISEDSVNFVGYWENETYSARLSWNWRSDYRLPGGGSFFGREERIVKDRLQMDLLLSYEPIEDVKLTFQAFNLTDEMLLEHDYRSDQLFRRAEYPGRTYSFKVSYTF